MAVKPCRPTVDQQCGACGATVPCQVAQVLLDGRLQWSASCRCPRCGDATEAFGWDETPPEIRSAILDQCGTATLRLVGYDDSQRLPLLKAFREWGASLGDAGRQVDDFVAHGLSGTSTEMARYAEKLGAHGIHTVVEAPG